MAIARMLPTNLFFIPEFSALYDSSKLAYIGLLLHADDEGRGRAEPRTLARAIDSYESEVQQSLEKLAASGLILLYEVEGKQYYQITRWEKMQKTRFKHESSFPPPPVAEHAITPDSTNNIPADSSATGNPHSSSSSQENQENQENNITTTTSSEIEKANSPAEETLMSLLGCSQKAAADLIAEFPTVTLPMPERQGASRRYSFSRRATHRIAPVWAVPFRQLRCRSTDTLCTLMYRLHHASAVFPPGGGLWHTVVFLRMALRHATRTLFSFQGTGTSVPVLSSLSLSSLTMNIQ